MPRHGSRDEMRVMVTTAIGDGRWVPVVAADGRSLADDGLAGKVRGHNSPFASSCKNFAARACLAEKGYSNSGYI